MAPLQLIFGSPQGGENPGKPSPEVGRDISDVVSADAENAPRELYLSPTNCANSSTTAVLAIRTSAFVAGFGTIPAGVGAKFSSRNMFRLKNARMTGSVFRNVIAPAFVETMCSSRGMLLISFSLCGHPGENGYTVLSPGAICRSGNAPRHRCHHVQTRRPGLRVMIRPGSSPPGPFR